MPGRGSRGGSGVRAGRFVLITSRDQEARLYRDKLWYGGRLRYLIAQKRPHAQLSLYDWIHEWKREHPADPGPLCLTTRRRLGKSFLSGTFTIERALALPNQVIKIGAPLYKQVREVFRSTFRKVLADCPRRLLPEVSGYTYTFRNPAWRDRWAQSEITLAGVNIERGDRLRGNECDLCILDEARNMLDVLYVQNDIIMPMFLERELPLLLYTTTMPRTLAHDYFEIWKQARREGRSKLFRVADLARDPLTPPHEEEDLDWKPAHEHLVLKNISKASATWRREYLCEEVSDPEAQIIPEFLEAKAEVIYEGEDYCDAHRGRPAFFQVTCGGDLGWEDYTAFVWAFHDFDEDLIVIEDELVRNRTTPKEIAKAMREIEKARYPEQYTSRRIVRYADADALTLAGLTLDERMPILPAEKWDRDSAIAKVRTRFSERKIRINARCKELLYQLEHGIWDDRRKEFIRSQTLGHCDALAALIYLVRMLNIHRNPRPKGGLPPTDPNKHYPPWDPPGGAPKPSTPPRRRPPGSPNPFGTWR